VYSSRNTLQYQRLLTHLTLTAYILGMNTIVEKTWENQDGGTISRAVIDGQTCYSLLCVFRHIHLWGQWFWATETIWTYCILYNYIYIYVCMYMYMYSTVLWLIFLVCYVHTQWMVRFCFQYYVNILHLCADNMCTSDYIYLPISSHIVIDMGIGQYKPTIC